ncbi:unnamed protein product [Mesocestoides corti]|nr:unnamed protein product [Mesocestoides corti]
MQNVVSQTPDEDDLHFPPTLNKLSVIKSRLPNHSDSLRESFSKYIGRMLNNLSEATEQEELTILNS